MFASINIFMFMFFADTTDILDMKNVTNTVSSRDITATMTSTVNSTWSTTTHIPTPDSTRPREIQDIIIKTMCLSTICHRCLC